MNDTIDTFEQYLDVVLDLVLATEPDHNVAVSVAAAIGSLTQRGHGELAMQVLETYKPEDN
jgi:hypothetical protein